MRGELTRAYYRFDPAMRLLGQVGPRSGFGNSFTTASIARADYRAQCFEQQRFADKVCFGWRGDADAVVLAFYRSSIRDTQALARLANLGLSALANSRAAAARADAPIVERIEARLRQHYPGLTSRETEICARTLAGWTADETARGLSLSVGTVLTYRQRGYARFGYSRATDFLARLLD